MYDINKVRSDFPILSRTVYDRPLVYLDNAATTQKPLCVLDAMREEYLNANAIHPNYRAALLCPGLMEGCVKNGVAVNPWTVNEAKDVMALAAKGANAVITNCPDVALRALGR